MQVDVSSHFQKSFQKLSLVIQEKAILRMKIFKESNGRDPRLDAHNLHGKKKNEWAYSVDHSYRIIFLCFLTAITFYIPILELMMSCINFIDGFHIET